MREGAVGYLVGPVNQGLKCMFSMMNNARLAVGHQGVSIAEQAYQQALSYATERVQGNAQGVEGRAPIIYHPDVQRMLMQMRALTGQGVLCPSLQLLQRIDPCITAMIKFDLIMHS